MKVLATDGLSQSGINKLKDAGFDVSDRITIMLHASDEVSDAATAHRNYICEQTLGDALTIGTMPDNVITSTHHINNDDVVISCNNDSTKCKIHYNNEV